MRSIAFIHIPHFPIAVERALSKRLRGRPLVAAMSPAPRARCLSVSDEAAAFGVRVGMAVGDARRHCRDVEIVGLNQPLFQRAGSAIQRILDEYTPLSQPARSGQTYLDLTGTGRLFGRPEDVALQLRGRLLSELRLPADAGLASNKLTSRVAAFDAKTEGLCRVDLGTEQIFLAPHRIGVLPVAARDIRATLTELNVRLVEQVLDVSPDHLFRAVGPLAFPLARQAKGIDPEPVLPPRLPPQIALSEELKTDEIDLNALEFILRRLVIEACFRLSHDRKEAAELLLTIYHSDGKLAHESKRLRAATADSGAWLEIAGELLRRAFTRRVRVRRLELAFGRLSGAEAQLDFTQTRRLGSALRAVEKLRERYGDKAVLLGLAA